MQTNDGTRLSNSCLAALKWLREHNGDGCFDRNGVAVAGGESAPFMRNTWNNLCDLGLVEFYGGRAQGLKGYGRLRVTTAGEGFDLR